MRLALTLSEVVGAEVARMASVEAAAEAPNVFVEQVEQVGEAQQQMDPDTHTQKRAQMSQNYLETRVLMIRPAGQLMG